MSNPAIRIFIEQVYDAIYDGGEYCRGCPQNELIENLIDYGNGKVPEYMRECKLIDSLHHNCPGVRDFLKEIKSFADEHKI